MKSEKQLWTEYKSTRSLSLRNQLVERYLFIAEHHAGRIYSLVKNHVEYDDLLQEAMVGLIQAIERFDPDRGIKFVTYSAFRVRGAVIDSLRDGGDFERHKQNAISEIGDGQEETIQKRAEEAGFSHQKIIELIQYYRVTHPSSISRVVVKGEHSTSGKDVLLGDTIPDRYQWDQEIHHKDFFDFVYMFVSLKQKIIIENIYEHDIDRQTLAKALGITEAGLYFKMRQIFKQFRNIYYLRETCEDQYSYAC